MTLLMRIAGVAMLGLVLAVCGGGGPGGDEGAIKEVFRDFFRAFEDGDASLLAGLLSDDCEDADSIAERAIQSSLSRGLEDVEYDVTGATIRDLTEDSAEAIPEGTSSVDGEEFPLVGSDDPEYARLIKVGGEWKLADCNILF